jgi:hypothetical protein
MQTKSLHAIQMSTSSDDRSPMAATVGIGIALEVLAGAMLSIGDSAACADPSSATM